MFFIGRRLSNGAVNAVCVGSVGLAMIFAFGAILQLIAREPAQRVVEIVLFDWVPAGAMHTMSGRLVNFNAQWGMLLDPLSAVMLGVVTGVGFLIHVYSTGYMAHEGGYYRFFGYLNLFMFSMLVLVLGNNLLLLFVGWEGVGLCSYLLIGFYFLRKSASDAGKKAFIVNRIGDAGFILGLLLLLNAIGTLRFTEIGPAIEAGGFTVGNGVMTAIALLLFVGATGKSAQIPLYVWLPDAMEGPTPVSALIHAATMVTAGVYMITRMNVVFQLAPVALAAVATVGAVTAIYAASMGLVQNDIKRVLAYSTVSQLGLHVSGAGRGRVHGGNFPPDDARVLQGAALPWFRQRDPRAGRRAGHAQDGRAVEQDSHYGVDVFGRHDRHFGNSAAGRIRQQRRDSGGFVQRAAVALGNRVRDRGDDGVLHVPAGVPDVFRRIARAATRWSTTFTNRRAR